MNEEVETEDHEETIKRMDLLEGDKDISLNVQDDTDRSEDALIAKLDLDSLRDALVNQSDRELFQRYYEKEESLTEIARGLDISRQAVTKRVKGMNEHLRSILKK